MAWPQVTLRAEGSIGARELIADDGSGAMPVLRRLTRYSGGGLTQYSGRGCFTQGVWQVHAGWVA